MTPNEIVKVIDEANVVYNETKTGFGYYLRLKEFKDKAYHKLYFKDYIEAGNVLYYYSRNEETGEMTLLTKVDHIDKEKKIIKKKLDDMTKEEIIKVRHRLCFNYRNCDGCPLKYKDVCLANCFKIWKEQIEETKDREFEIEVEE